jgi:hypothetical protein
MQPGKQGWPRLLLLLLFAAVYFGIDWRFHSAASVLA